LLGGRSLQSSVESFRQSALFVQLMFDGFGLPGHTYGSGSDSPDIDSQGMIERAMRAMLMASKPGGQFLTSPHTFKHCREVAVPINFTRSPRHSWAIEGSRDLNERVKEYLRKVMADAGPIELPEEVSRELDEIVKMGDEKLC